MKKLKYILVIVVLLIGAWIISSIFSSQNKADLRKAVEKSTPEETVILVKTEIQILVIKTSGRMYAFNKVEIFAEVSGILETSSNRFKAGQRFNNGDVMININSDVFRNSLLAKKSNLLNQLGFLLADAKVDFPDSYQKWESYLSNFDMHKPLDALPSDLTKRETQYLASHNILNLYYEIKSMEATFDKYTIEAPYNGIVTESNINPGTLVRNGQKLGEFINTTLFEMSTPVKASEIRKLSIGDEVELTTVDNNKLYRAKVVRINSTIDQQTQSVQVYIQSNEKGILDGMFFNAIMKVESGQKLARLPLGAVNSSNQVKVRTGEGTQFVNVKIIESSATDCLVEGLEDSSHVVLDNLTN
jgi:multidrug efflux pump subunit AcrA (membrane-fusion protein)